MFDELYSASKNGKNFTKIYDLIINRENILLAYRNIRKNKGSKTRGTNKNTIVNISAHKSDVIVNYVRKRLKNYQPHKVRRVLIPKEGGKERPLGIPTIEDRLIQQCIKQILEPICEAKFHKHSYGFRPNRGSKHAVSRSYTLMNINKLHYVVDIDIKGFFDNVNHGKLLKQMWSLGIRDKKVLSIVGKMLKTEIEGKGIPEKGTPQGGILSPLLSNIVLNELDWWLSSQWETFETKYDYTRYRMIGNKKRFDQSGKYSTLKKTKLKELFFVRYADDFKIFCRDPKTAFKMLEGTKKWLMDRLGLEISEEKSKVVNLRKNYSDFLGIRMKVVPKGKKHVVKSRMTTKAMKKAERNIIERAIKIKKATNQVNIANYNSVILGIQNYYDMATHITKDLSILEYRTRRRRYNLVDKYAKLKGEFSRTFKEIYGSYLHRKIYFAKGINLFPISAMKHKRARNFTQEKNNYTAEGRMLIHKELTGISMEIVNYIMKNPIETASVEYNDNRVTRYIAQKGKCYVTKEELEVGNMELHHMKPRNKGGKDEYENLRFVTRDVHKLIHAINEETIKKYLEIVKPKQNEIVKINILRKKVGNLVI